MSDMITEYAGDQRTTDAKLAEILDKLADGNSVRLGEFSDNASSATEADTLASQLREIAESLREGNLQV